MPSALETLVKILKLERQQGYKNKAVIGGLDAYRANWSRDAHTQARRPEHHILVDELDDLLGRYAQIDAVDERHATITYMLDRITGRVPPPPAYLARLEDRRQAQQASPEVAGEPEDTQRVEGKTPQEPASSEPRQRAVKPRVERPATAASQPTGEGDAEDEEQAGRKPRKSRSRRKRKDRKDTAAAPSEGTPPTHERRPPPPTPDLIHDEDSAEDLTPVYETGFDDIPDLDIEPSYVDEVSEENGQVPYSSNRRAPRHDLPPAMTLERPPRLPRPVQDAEEAADILRGLRAPVTTVKGVGEAMAANLAKLGIHSIDDMLFYLPRRHDDYTQLKPINKLPVDEVVTVIGTVTRAEIRAGRGGRRDFYIELDDGSGVLSITFFGMHFLVRNLRPGKQIVVSGKTSVFRERLQMANPEWEALDSDNLHTVGIVPVYGLTQGLTARTLRRLMQKTVTYWADRLPDYVPEPVLDRCELGDLGWTIRNLHFPESHDHLHHAQRRYLFDQLLTLQLAILRNRRDWQSVPGQPLPVSDAFMETFIEAVFPYPLTRAQRRAIDDIRRDIASDVPMNRLLQGDVGSGKTAVAVAAMAMAFANGKQAALMAPTGILAEQHYRGITRTLEAIPGERRPVIGLLTSALTTTEREAVYNGLADGSIDIIIGTHALIQEGVIFNDLGLVVVDEQHRFGVEQRGRLRGKGTNPHLLVMTATPIPRTLALTLYADLDLSIMDEMPPGRTPIATKVIMPSEREITYRFIEREIEKGRQAFIVYPLVEASESIDAGSAVEAYEQLSQVFFRHRVGLLHGKMKPAEKDAIMASFANHEFDVMVTTSVAEVGVDIPNASVIVIDGANRFGLAQLHQFRGRVGRGQHVSYCFLIPDDATVDTPYRLKNMELADIENKAYPESERRLKAMELSTDGFMLAEIDWKLRGAGDLVGTRQSGKSLLQAAQAITPELVSLAQREARTLYEEDPYLTAAEHQLLKERVSMLHDERSDLS